MPSAGERADSFRCSRRTSRSRVVTSRWAHRAVSRERVNDFIASYLGQDQSREPPLRAASLRGHRSVGRDGRGNAVTTAVRPQPGVPRAYRFPAFQRRTLPNGLHLIVASAPKLPVVSMMAIIDAGAICDPPGREGLAQLTARALIEGTAALDGPEYGVSRERGSVDPLADGTYQSREHHRHDRPRARGPHCSPRSHEQSFPRARSAAAKERHSRCFNSGEPRGMGDGCSGASSMARVTLCGAEGGNERRFSRSRERRAAFHRSDGPVPR